MSREERAKQFMPFAALKGYQEALRKKEEFIEEQRKMQEKGNAYDDLPELDKGED